MVSTSAHALKMNFETYEKLPAIVAAGRQTAAMAQETALTVPHCGMPKAATPVLQRSPLTEALL
jgi:hypothetical protein